MSKTPNPQNTSSDAETPRSFVPGDPNGRYLILVFDEINGGDDHYRTADLTDAVAAFDRARTGDPYVTGVVLYDTVTATNRKEWHRDPNATPQTALARYR